MADILKITTPITDRSVVSANRAVTDPSAPFHLSDVAKVINPGEQSEILQQNNGFLERENSAVILMNLLKDPSVTVSFLKNIDMLQEIIKLIPVNNQTLTDEIGQLFNDMLIAPEDIAEELLKQEQASTCFKGDLFDFLRQQMAQNNKPEIRDSICHLLKSLNAISSQQKILKSISNGLFFLSKNMTSSASLSQQLSELATRFNMPRAYSNFPELKDQTLALLNSVKSSILYSPKLQKVLPMIIYNLSRFNNNPHFLKECIDSLSTILDGDAQKQMLADLMYGYTQISDKQEPSKVMDTIAQIISKQSNNSELATIGGEKIEKVIYSLLSSPCNFTPLLHYIVPVQSDGLRSFAEIWIDPNAESTNAKSERVQGCIHMLIVFDIDGIGRFEAELAVAEKEIMINLFCPAPYLPSFSALATPVRAQIDATGYRLLKMSVEKLEKHRSLMDVFKTLPHKRTGVDVKV
ncbi:MAG: antitoxin [Candidatus Fimivivens sp.]